MNPRTVLVVSVLAASVALGSGCQRRGGTKVIGSTSIQPFAEMLAQTFNARHSEYNIEVQGGGSTTGLQSVITEPNPLADIGMCSRALKSEELGKYDFTIIAYDGLAVVVHPSNPVSGLTREQVALIFSGDITNWKQVGGEDREIHVITREEGSGTREAFMGMIMDKTREELLKKNPKGYDDLQLVNNKGRIFRRAVTQESNGAVKALIREPEGDRAAIGYMSLGIVLQDHSLKPLQVDGVEPTMENVRGGHYKLKRPFLFVFRKGSTPGEAAKAFCEFVLSDDGQAMLKREGLTDLTLQERHLPWKAATTASEPAAQSSPSAGGQ